jgi:hypothetical protein
MATTKTTPPVAAARVPVTFTIASGRLRPRVVSIPKLLPVALTIHNRTTAPVSVTMERLTGTIHIPAGGTASERVEPLPKGRYEVRAGGAGRATVVTGVAPGP